MAALKDSTESLSTEVEPIFRLRSKKSRVLLSLPHMLLIWLSNLRLLLMVTSDILSCQLIRGHNWISLVFYYVRLWARYIYLGERPPSTIVATVLVYQDLFAGVCHRCLIQLPDMSLYHLFPFQILRSMADLSNRRRPFQRDLYICFYLVTWWMWVRFVHHLHCILYQMNSRCQSSRYKFGAPDPRFVSKKTHQLPSYLSKFECKIRYDIEWPI